jgi:hypothetical protein
VFEQGINGFVTISPTSEYSPWGLLTYRFRTAQPLRT